MNLTSFNLLFLVLIVLLAVIYLFQINFMVSGGFKLHTLEQSVSDMQKQNNSLEIGVLDLQSMQKIRERAAEAGLVPINKATYVSANPPVVAFK